MIGRRHLVTGGVLGGMLAELATGEAAAAPAEGQTQASEQSMEQIAKAIDALRSEVRGQRDFLEIVEVREAQKRFLRANGKLPDVIDVGVDVWFAVHDWHVRWQQPMVIGRDPLGRLTIVLLQTLLILRTDSAGNFMGSPYDRQ